jgi:hypothetical protein
MIRARVGRYLCVVAERARSSEGRTPGPIAADSAHTARYGYSGFVESSRTSNDDGSSLLSGVVIGSVLFGGDAHGSPPAVSADPPEASGDSGGSIGGGSDDGFSTGGEL